MEHLQDVSSQNLIAHAINDMADAVSRRPGETAHQCSIRSRIATEMIRSLVPLDMIEVMLAGQAVMFHALISDSVQHAFGGEIASARRGTRATIIGMNRAFH